MQCIVRTLMAVGEVTGTKIPSEHSINGWIIERAADLNTRIRVGRDRKTSYERLKGRTSHTQVVFFGEKARATSPQHPKPLTVFFFFQSFFFHTLVFLCVRSYLFCWFSYVSFFCSFFFLACPLFFFLFSNALTF